LFLFVAWAGGVLGLQGVIKAGGIGRKLEARQMDTEKDPEKRVLTISAPLMATILILFGIGYTIDYNSMSFLFSHDVRLPSSLSLAALSPFQPLRLQCTSNTTRTELIRVWSRMHHHKSKVVSKRSVEDVLHKERRSDKHRV